MPFPVRAVLALVLLLLAAPAGARAATVEVWRGTLYVSGAAGEGNRLNLSLAGGVYTVADEGASMFPRAGCLQPAAGRVTCAATGISRIDVDLGDGDDVAVLGTTTLPIAVDDGAGNDQVSAGAGADTFAGAPGDDRLVGGAGDDVFTDAGGAGADVLEGGPGTDHATYALRTAGVRVDQDAEADDGAPGEGDRIASDVERLTGGRGADVLVGGDGAGQLVGGDGNDVLDGGLGPDKLDGGYGQDRVSYASRTGSVGADPDLVADDGAPGEGDSIGSDVEDLEGGAGNDILAGSGFRNVLDGGAGDDTLRGREKEDTILGGPGDDLVDGGTENDRLDGGEGADTLMGGPGTDLADYSARMVPVVVWIDAKADDGAPGEGDLVGDDVEQVLGGGGDDELHGGPAAEALDGGPGADRLFGGPGDDLLTGGAGDDTLDGETGRDTFAGGEGRDTASYALRSGTVVADLDGRANDGEPGENDTVRTDVEDLRGGAGADRLTGDWRANRIEGGDGSDRLLGDGADDVLDGGEGDDTLDGGRGADRLGGGGGRDVADYAARGAVLVSLDGLANDGERDEGDLVEPDVEIAQGSRYEDQLIGGPGGDELRGGGGRDTLTGLAGNDLLLGGDGEDRFDPGAGDDRVEGGADRDAIDFSAFSSPVDVSLANGRPDPGDVIVEVERGIGGDGRDHLTGGPSDDELIGRGGDDVFRGGPGADVFRGDDGQDLVDYSDRSEPIRATADGQANDGAAGEGDDVEGTIDDAIGGAGGDELLFRDHWPHYLRGGDGEDRLTTGDAADRLHGGPGGDTLDAAGADDELLGGDGNDLLKPGGGTDAVDAGAGNDVIEAADGIRETIRCGTGRDRAVADKADKLVACEEKDTGQASLGGPGGGGSSTAGPATPVTPAGTVAGAKTIVGRGRFVTIPGFPGERIDRRLLRDIRYLRATYRIHITDGLAGSGHAPNGEHPRGLAIDVVPGPGGTWDDIDRLARWAEPRRNQPRAPFRWVGYDGDRNHGRGHHLHLSWNHAPVAAGRPARWVQVLDLREPAAVKPSGMPAWTRTNGALGRRPSVRTGLPSISPCSGAAPLVPTWKAAGRAFGIRWQILAAITEIESGFGCNMGPSSAGALGWTQFMPATWKAYGMDASGNGKASPYDSADAVFSSARYLRASGAPRSYRKALYAYNHAWWYVRDVLDRARKFR